MNYYLITLVSRGNRCPRCGTYSKKVHGYKDRKITHSILLNENLNVLYHQRRYICPSCKKTFIEINPFVSNHPGLSKKTIDNILLLLKEYNQTISSVARLTHVSVSEVIEVFDEHVRIKRKKMQEVICID